MKDERGSMVVETVILTPVLVLLLSFVVYASRVVTAQHEINRAADVAARAASQSRISSVTRVGMEVAESSLRENKVPCQELKTRVSRKSISGVSHVEVQTQCVVNIRGLSLLGIRSPVVSSVSTEVIDVYRHP
jgi:Flp pilus assembly protein TadG